MRALAVVFLFLCVCQITLAQPSKSSRIAIIGGGASGVSAGWWLKTNGFQNVKLFEKDAELGGFARTIQADGYYYDTATMFVPGSTVLGHGINPAQKLVIDYSEMSLSPAPDFDTLLTNGSTPRLVPYAEVLMKYDSATVIDHLVRGYIHSLEVFNCSAQRKTCVACGICLAFNETMVQLGARKNLSAFVDLVTYIVDGLGAGPSAFGSAFSLLGSTMWWLPVEIHRSLRFLGYSATNLPPNAPPSLISLFQANGTAGTQRWWQLDQGFQNFWKKVASKAQIDVALSEPVTSLTRVSGVWKLTTQKGSYDFDIVIATSAPQDTFTYLESGDQKTILPKAFPFVPPNDIFLIRAPGLNAVGLPERYAFWPTGLGIGATTLDLTGQPFFFQKRHPAEIMVIATYSLPSLSQDSVLELVKNYTKKTLGISLGQEINRRRVLFPAGVRGNDIQEWLGTWQTLQGKDGLYMIGEAFSGSGVPAISTYLFNSFFPTYFSTPATSAPTTSAPSTAPPTTAPPATAPPTTAPPATAPPSTAPPTTAPPATAPPVTASPNGARNVININFSGMFKGYAGLR
eukprot:TRINITY_DN3152_c0_g1_i1.p1 TRINITY_DN3152_c0_g1~~TRINITY_DN3152_c0_g1_i1.p1  ORF type:complete len:572 (-),score=112.73 TRINITY_DN3152_c0_g1_i1:89-1804(-)